MILSRLIESGIRISLIRETLSLKSSTNMVRIGVTTSIIILTMKVRKLQRALKGMKMSLIRTDIAEKRGAIKVPNTPGWNIKFIIELNGEESEIT